MLCSYIDNLARKKILYDDLGNEVEHICINKKNIKKCNACGKRGWGICGDEHICIQKDDFNAEDYGFTSNNCQYFVLPFHLLE